MEDAYKGENLPSSIHDGHSCQDSVTAIGYDFTPYTMYTERLTNYNDNQLKICTVLPVRKFMRNQYFRFDYFVFWRQYGLAY